MVLVGLGRSALGLIELALGDDFDGLRLVLEDARWLVVVRLELVCDYSDVFERRTAFQCGRQGYLHVGIRLPQRKLFIHHYTRITISDNYYWIIA